MAKKKVVQKAKKRKIPSVRKVSTEIVVRVEQAPLIPTVTDLAEPMTDGGKKLTIPKTWLGQNQLQFMLQRTPREQVYRRKGRGGQTFDYVTGSYITKALNYVFAWNWDFEVVQHGKEADHVWVLGKLTVHGARPGQTISKTQFGRSDVKQLKAGGNLDYGNDLKAATTDALKKCASMLGFASDIYGKGDYKAESGQDPLPPRDPALPQGKVYEEPTVQQGAPLAPFEDHVCQYLGKGGCGADLTKQEAEYAKRVYGRELCKEHFPIKK